MFKTVRYYSVRRNNRTGMQNPQCLKRMLAS
jgi:hypothetical protein